MEIRPLTETPLETTVECLTRAFSDYFVQMPADPIYWRKRWKGARVDYRASFGAFEKEQLVGFMIHGLDFRNGLYTAFNTGTGVVPAFRGQRLVGKMYETALPQLENRGIRACSLEVIQENEKAVKAYQKVGFSIVRELKC